MPAGNAQLVPIIWQQLPGASRAEIYPYIRKVDVISSNSYLIRTPDAILLIDPGGLTDQAEMLASVIAGCRAERDRPVFVILTHAHVDHFNGMRDVPAFAYANTAVLMVQEEGALALERGDRFLTQAGMFNVSIPPIQVGVHLFSPTRQDQADIPVELYPANEGHLVITRSPEDHAGNRTAHERIMVGASLVVDCYHTPGHSPDSICIRIGSLFFIGDLLFAANPGVAGLSGWSQEGLVRSLSMMEPLLSGEEITIICPGHGRTITPKDAASMMTMVKKDALALSDIAEFNRERATEAAVYAEDCMEEVNELFTIMAGRLDYVAYVLSELGEAGIAENASALMNGDKVDELLDAFRSFAEEHHRGQNLSVHLALKAGQVIGKLERSFNKSDLARIIDPSMIRRAERLLSDYTTMFRGYTPPREIAPVDLSSLLDVLVAGFTIPPCSDDDVLSSTDDDSAFAAILMARIGARPLLEDVDFSMEGKPEHLPVVLDRDLFTDLITYVLEDLVGIGSDTIRAEVRTTDTAAMLTITGNVVTADTETGRTRRFLHGLSERAGGSLTTGRDESGATQYMIQVSRAI